MAGAKEKKAKAEVVLQDVAEVEEPEELEGLEHKQRSERQSFMYNFFATKLKAGLSQKDVHKAWKEEASGTPADMPKDHMRDGHQYYLKYGRKEQGVTAAKAKQAWKTFSQLDRKEWHEKAKFHNRVVSALTDV